MLVSTDGSLKSCTSDTGIDLTDYLITGSTCRSGGGDTETPLERGGEWTHGTTATTTRRSEDVAIAKISKVVHDRTILEFCTINVAAAMNSPANGGLYVGHNVTGARSMTGLLRHSSDLASRRLRHSGCQTLPLLWGEKKNLFSAAAGAGAPTYTTYGGGRPALLTSVPVLAISSVCDNIYRYQSAAAGAGAPTYTTYGGGRPALLTSVPLLAKYLSLLELSGSTSIHRPSLGNCNLFFVCV
ncbi:hypothetical protein J6590_024487 [Homalodisca vitripennis]|nr:hypothetical protein J6590_024487 [Homalodisca vitripennis]